MVWKLPYQRRKKLTSIDVLAASCCWMPVENSQLYCRLPQPVSRLGSYDVPGMMVPKFGSATAPHSPFAAKFCRLQFGILSLLLSVHPRTALLTRRLIGFGSDDSPFSPNAN